MAELTLDGIKKLLDNQTQQITTNVNSTLAKLKDALRKNQENTQKLQERCLFLERKVRKNNIVVFGLDIEDSKLIEETISTLNKHLGLNITANDINNIYKIGKSKQPPIVVEFISFLKKLEIFKNPEKLKALKGTNLAISNDLCEQDRENNKILLKHLKIARSENKPARIRGSKIEISNVLYTVKELEDCSDTEFYETDDQVSESESENETDSTQEKQGQVKQLDRVKTKNKQDQIDAKKRKREKKDSPEIRQTRNRKGRKY